MRRNVHVPLLHTVLSPLAVGVLGMVTISSVLAEEHAATIAFSIKQKTADEALIEFAEQAGLTVIFPYNKVRHTIANPLQARLTVTQALSQLLAGTNLTARLDEKNHVRISVLPAEEPSNWLSQWFHELTAAQDDLLMVPMSDDAEMVEYIEVKGLRARTSQSVSIKRDADYVLDTIQSLEMGKFPDQNLAEALQRVPGVAIDRAEGEGQFVTVRGFGPQFNQVLLNGRQLATDTLGRQFSFDTVAPELVSAVTVHKQGRADLPTGGIGSTINVQTSRPLALRGLRVAGSVKMQYDANSGKTSPQASVLFSDTFFNDKIGLLLSYSDYARHARIDEAQIDGWVVNTNVPDAQLDRPVDTLYVPRKYDQRVRFEQRHRQGATLVWQYRPNDKTEFTLDYLGTRYNIDSSATSMGHWFTSSNLENVITDSNGTAVRFSQRVGHATDFHARSFNRDTALHSAGIALNWQASDNLVLDIDLSGSRASVDDPQGEGDALSLIGYLNQSTFDHTQGNILPAISHFDAANPAQINAEGVVSGVQNYLDPANGRAHVMLKRGWQIEDTISQASVDARWHPPGQAISWLDGGMRIARQSKDNERRDNEINGLHCYFCGYFDAPDLPDDFQQVFDAGDDFLASVSGHQTIPHAWLRHDGPQLFAYLEDAAQVDLSPVRRGNSYQVTETVQAAYLNISLDYAPGPLLVTVNGGVRFENTQVSVDGLYEPLVGLEILDQTELGQVIGSIQQVHQTHHYSNWLPALSARFAWQDNWVLRTGYARSLTRPTLEQMSPGMRYTTTRQGGDLRASVGNPALKPFVADNFDMALEYYYQQSNYLSLGVFRKYVDNFITIDSQEQIFSGVTDPSTGNDPLKADALDEIARFAVAQPFNSETATVDGVELSAQHLFGKSGWGVQANLSAVSSNAELDKTDINRKFALTGLSGAKNVVVFYEKNALQWRLAWNYRDGFLQSLEQPLSTEPTYVSPYKQWDISASYALNSQVSVFIEGINLTNETVHKHGRFSNQLLLVQDTGSRFALGIRATY